MTKQLKKSPLHQKKYNRKQQSDPPSKGAVPYGNFVVFFPQRDQQFDILLSTPWIFTPKTSGKRSDPPWRPSPRGVVPSTRTFGENSARRPNTSVTVCLLRNEHIQSPEPELFWVLMIFPKFTRVKGDVTFAEGVKLFEDIKNLGSNSCIS